MLKWIQNIEKYYSNYFKIVFCILDITINLTILLIFLKHIRVKYYGFGVFFKYYNLIKYILILGFILLLFDKHTHFMIFYYIIFNDFNFT